MDNVEKLGGYRFLSHKNAMGVECNPVYVLSAEGYNQLTKETNTSLCPICYSQLSKNDFVATGPKPESVEEMIAFSRYTPNLFAHNAPAATVVASAPKDKSGIVVVLKGVVGAGKSTYGEKVKELVEQLGGHCTVEGTDKYCKDGKSITEAIKLVNTALRNALTVDNQLNVVVIDTCGDRDNGKTFFDVTFDSWKKVLLWPNLDRKNLQGYLAWSLRNVLSRGTPSADGNFYLSPKTAGVTVCADVHKRKTLALFGKKTPVPSISGSIESAIATLDGDAAAYEAMLAEKFPIDKIIEEFVKVNLL
jgi:hypothetical protein